MNSRDKVVELISVTLTNEAGYRAFVNMDFGLGSGEIAIIVGPTGSGKTSIAELIMGILKPDSGEIAVFGKLLKAGNERQINEIRRKIGGVGGIFGLINDLTVSENLLYPLRIRGDSFSFQKAKLKQILTQFNLLGKKREKALNLTRGEKILAMLGRAVIADQPLLIIDEPLDRLGDTMAVGILALLKRLSVAGHTMIILTTGQINFEIPGAKEYHIKNGRLE